MGQSRKDALEIPKSKMECSKTATLHFLFGYVTTNS